MVSSQNNSKPNQKPLRWNPRPRDSSFSARRLMNNKYKLGEEQPPCLTPQWTRKNLEIVLLITTADLEEEYKVRKSLRNFPLIPNSCQVINRPSNQTRSKAFLTSKKQKNRGDLDTKLLCINSLTTKTQSKDE